MAGIDAARSKPADRGPRGSHPQRQPRKSKALNIPQNGSEADLHVTIAEFLDWALSSPAFYTTFPAGWGKLRGQTAFRLKRSGLKAGMPDILVFYRGQTMGIELKVYGAAASSVQRTTFAALQGAGVPIYICRSIEDVVEALNRCRIPFRFTSGRIAC